MPDWNRFWIELTPHCLRRAPLLDALMRSAMRGLAAADSRLRTYRDDERRRRGYGPSAQQIQRMVEDLLRQYTLGYRWQVEIGDTEAVRNPALHRLREAAPLDVPPAPGWVPVRRQADCTEPRSFTVRVRLWMQDRHTWRADTLVDILRQAVDTYRAAGHQFRLLVVWPDTTEQRVDFQDIH